MKSLLEEYLNCNTLDINVRLCAQLMSSGGGGFDCIYVTWHTINCNIICALQTSKVFLWFWY